MQQAGQAIGQPITQSSGNKTNVFGNIIGPNLNNNSTQKPNDHNISL
jgi:hypothetical protein